MATFLERLEHAAQANRSLLCVGLDPDPTLMPIADVAAFNRAIIQATADLVCAYKPNLAFYEAQGIPGLHALEATLKAIPPHIPVIADAKRGDIGNTARFYARAIFDVWGFDAVTLNPLMGADSLEPWLEYRDRAVLLLCRTSNPGARDILELTVSDGKGAQPLYERIALLARAWDRHGNVGLVVGATAPQELARVRSLCPEMPILVPGIGAQAGDLEATIRSGVDRRGRRAIINVSRGVAYASRDAAFAQAARAAAQRLRHQVNTLLEAQGQAW